MNTLPSPLFEAIEQAATFLPLGAPLTWGVVFASVIIFVLYSLLILYHWLRYGEGARPIFVAMILYFSISLVLFIGIFFSAAHLT